MNGEMSFINFFDRDVFRNPVKILWWSVSAKIVESFQLSAIFALL